MIDLFNSENYLARIRVRYTVSMATSLTVGDVSPSEQAAVTSTPNETAQDSGKRTVSKSSKFSNNDKRNIDCKVFLPDGETVSFDVDVSVYIAIHVNSILNSAKSKVLT